MPEAGRVAREARDAKDARDTPRLLERSRSLVWGLPVLIALTELVAHATMIARRPSRHDYAAATHYVAAHLRPRDQVVAEPSWTDPLLREQIGDRLGIARAGSIDFEEWDRVHVVSIHGHRAEAFADRAPSAVRYFGAVNVARYDLGPSPVLYDFTDHWRQATALLVENGAERACELTRMPPHGGGLGTGDYWPSERMACDPGRPWLFFAPTINEDRDLALRRCLWQHPSGPEPFRVTYPDVPLGERLVVYADIYYENERNEMHGLVPFELRVLVDGRDVGTMRHFDGQGRKRMVVPTQELGRNPSRTGTVTFETTSADPHFRGVCWSGTTRGPERRQVPR